MGSHDWALSIGGVITAVATIYGAHLASRAAVRAGNTTREVGLATLEATREDKFIERLENRLQAVETESSGNVERVEAQRHVIFRLQERVESLERGARRDADLIDQLRRFIRQLIEAWPSGGPPFVPPPAPPPGLLED